MTYIAAAVGIFVLLAAVFAVGILTKKPEEHWTGAASALGLEYKTVFPAKSRITGTLDGHPVVVDHKRLGDPDTYSPRYLRIRVTAELNREISLDTVADSVAGVALDRALLNMYKTGDEAFDAKVRVMGDEEALPRMLTPEVQAWILGVVTETPLGFRVSKGVVTGLVQERKADTAILTQAIRDTVTLAEHLERPWMPSQAP